MGICSGTQHWEIAEALLNKAKVARRPIQEGTDILENPNALEAFQMANCAIARSLRQRLTHNTDQDPDEEISPPRWRPFQLAFMLTNDPLCAQHEPDNHQEERFLHGSACHHCFLIAPSSQKHLWDTALKIRSRFFQQTLHKSS